MPDFAVSPEKNKWLKDKMRSLNIKEEDIIERFVRSSGKGGQKVNKSSSCVYLKHIPTGIEVKCMTNRSQSVNRFLARRKLIERIEGSLGVENKEILRIKRKKAKSKKRAQRKYNKEREANGVA